MLFEMFLRIELLKNSIVQINKIALIYRIHEIETDGELIFQQL